MNLLLPITLLAIVLLPCEAIGGSQKSGGVEFSGLGFLTLSAGKIFKGDPPQDFNGYNTPIYVVDYAQGGIYSGNNWTLNPVSRLGWQETATFNSEFSLTGQVVARGARNGKIDLEWIYANLGLTNNMTLQVGRKRLPLFYYSESQDVGFSYPWIYLPPGQYGWEIVNYNGANLLYRAQWGSWTAAINIFAGSETKNDNPYWKIYYGRNSRTDSKWSDLVGTDLSLVKDWFEIRLAYIQSKYQDRVTSPSTVPYPDSPKARQQIYALSFVGDYHHWLLHNEYLYMNRKQAGEAEYSFLLGLGYRIDHYLPMLTYNYFKQRLTPANADTNVINPANLDPLSVERWATLSGSLRYELTPNSTIKTQIDRWLDKGGPTFNAGVPYGNAWLFSISYDLLF
ncbi:conserved hypothetical protein [Gammaproteobacteria bacterium]